MSSSSVTADQRGSKSGVTPFVSVNPQAILLELWVSNAVNPNIEWEGPVEVSGPRKQSAGRLLGQQ